MCIRDSYAVGIGVGSQHQVGTGLGGQLQTQLQCLEDLGVGVDVYKRQRC